MGLQVPFAPYILVAFFFLIISYYLLYSIIYLHRDFDIYIYIYVYIYCPREIMCHMLDSL